MSRLTEIIAYVKSQNPQIGAELENEFKEHSSRLAFGLNFERHRPEVVELPKRTVRKGDKVRKLSPRGEKLKTDPRVWIVKKISEVKNKKIALIGIIENKKSVLEEVPIDDLIVIAEFRDYLYPGLVSTGKVERGGDKPFHTVINGENYHVLKALTYSHRGKVDAIYIDPPYNSGAKDWKYNNDYVEKEDLYRHSKWLAFMERRLLVAKELLNPKKSVLILTIDEKEVNRISLLLEQVYPEAIVQMVTVVINPKGSTRGKELARVDEYILICYFGEARAKPTKRELLENSISSKSGKTPQIWYPLIRSGTDIKRTDNPNGFYPIYIDKEKGKVVEIGESILPVTIPRSKVKNKSGLITVLPTLSDGTDGRWQVSYKKLAELVKNGMVKVGSLNSKTKQITITYLKSGEIKRIETGEIVSTGRDANGTLMLEYANLAARERVGKTVWNTSAHDAGEHGSKLLKKLLIDRKFPFPKSLYAVEDALRFFIEDNKNAIVLDFFSGSGTTAHAVMRLNKQDNGIRQCISITNNEVGAEEQTELRSRGLRPGDNEWEKLGICNYITKPRVEAAITGKTPQGKDIEGEYKFIQVFPISEGFNENAEFFDLTYETSIAVSHNLAFSRIAPLLWMKAGSQGKRICTIPKIGYEVVESYGLLVDLDKATDFCKEICKAHSVRVAYIVTNDERRYQIIIKRLPESVEPVRLYESYLKNFEINGGE